MTSSARDIEHALERIVALGEPAAGGPGVLVGSRRAILDVVRASPSPISVDDIAALTDLHVNTTRHHLDVLTAAGLLERAEAVPEGRGRPKARYRASAAAVDAFDSLGRELEDALRAHSMDEVAIATARRWLDAAPAVEAAKDLDGAVIAAVDALRAVGFDARSDAIGDSIVVTDCPYASLIPEHPMICTVHAELTARVLARTGQPLELEALDVWVRPGACRARLRRPDTAPSFTTAPISRNDAQEDPR